MDWLENLLWGNSIAHSIFIFAAVISFGFLLGKIKFFGVSLGVTFVLFVGIAAGHFGFTVNPEILAFVKDFGLILFVFFIGLQVGPGFFSSFKKDGLQMNLLTCATIILNIFVALTIFYLAGNISMPMMVGVLSGAVTNTPGLGAAQSALEQAGSTDPIAIGYAIAYPIGVIGVITALLALRYFFKIKLDKENESLQNNKYSDIQQPKLLTLEINNPAIFGKSILEIAKLFDKKFIISRIFTNGKLQLPTSESILQQGDKILLAVSGVDVDIITAFIGKKAETIDWNTLSSDENFEMRKITITRSNINGKHLGSLRLRSIYGVNVTRVIRAETNLLANPNLTLRIGDTLVVVGDAQAIDNVAKYLGNSIKRLRTPNIVTIFSGIMLGILLGCIPIKFPGIPMPVKLGLAGGSLIIAILIGRFGHNFKMVAYTSQSANLMLREIGITLFLSSVGISAGENFVATLVSGAGLQWLLWGALITIIPAMIIAVIARLVLKMNYFSLMGVIGGSYTDPPVLAYSSNVAGNDSPAIAYSTVYPLAMFLRVLTAQLLIMIFV
ncbi:MAG: putative transporter [Prevotellaceae bacterium]|jgi:putative transport protein|nr:putative transporter [Prevotellaceae bacterium]